MKDQKSLAYINLFGILGARGKLAELDDAARALLTAWRTQLGWYVKVETVADEAALTARVASGDYQVALTGIRAAEDGAAAYLRQVAAYTGVSAPAPDDTIESLREAEDALLRSLSLIHI